MEGEGADEGEAVDVAEVDFAGEEEEGAEEEEEENGAREVRVVHYVLRDGVERVQDCECLLFVTMRRGLARVRSSVSAFLDHVDIWCQPSPERKGHTTPKIHSFQKHVAAAILFPFECVCVCACACM